MWSKLFQHFTDCSGTLVCFVTVLGIDVPDIFNAFPNKGNTYVSVLMVGWLVGQSISRSLWSILQLHVFMDCYKMYDQYQE